MFVKAGYLCGAALACAGAVAAGAARAEIACSRDGDTLWVRGALVDKRLRETQAAQVVDMGKDAPIAIVECESASGPASAELACKAGQSRVQVTWTGLGLVRFACVKAPVPEPVADDDDPDEPKVQPSRGLGEGENE